MRTVGYIAALILAISVVPAMAMPVVQVADVIGNPVRYRDVRVKLSGQVTKVEADPLASGGVTYLLQDQSDQVIRIKSRIAPNLDSYIDVVGIVVQDDAAAKPYLLEVKHVKAGIALSVLIGIGGVLVLSAVALCYLILVPRPAAKKHQPKSDEPEFERRPIITQVFRDDPVALLVALCGPYKGEVFKVYNGTNTIGRDDNQTVQLTDDSTVSRSHARIDASEGSLIIKNESHTNPTKIEEQDIDERELADGDIIQIGSTRFRVTIVSG
ncbi:MAG: FHA domain-containing protein [Armatimonadota bacterium]